VLGQDGGALAGDGGIVRGCQLGTSCRPGSDLAPPDSTDGFQIVTPPGMFTVGPGQETYPNYCALVPGNAEFDVGTGQSWMTPGSSRDLIVYQGAAPSAGSVSPCSLGADTWIFAASNSGEIVELKMPDGVGVPLPAGGEIIVNMHFINVGSSTEEPQVKVNFLRTRNLQYRAAAMVSFNGSIDVPAATPSGPGQETVMGMCTAPAGANFFAIGTHTHGHATVADVNFVSGAATTNVVHTTDWRNPDVGIWMAPPFLSVHTGDSFTYSCAYSNTGASPVTVGETQSNEVCETVSYYFPAGSADCN
jgi:hypothetical protein